MVVSVRMMRVANMMVTVVKAMSVNMAHIVVIVVSGLMLGF